MFEFASFLEIAKSAAKRGGKFIEDNKDQDQQILFDQGRDIKLQIDQDVEKIIVSYLKSQTPFPILAEEFGITEELGEYYWVVDPLDGTSNFLRNIPISCVSVALMHNLDPIIGVIYDFNHNDLYYSHKESKAFLNDKEITVSNLFLKNKSTLVTGIPAKTNYSDDEFKRMIINFQAWKKIRMIGSAAMASVYVASGRAETYQEHGIFLWDVAAGAAIVKSAGGKIQIDNMQADYRVDAIFTNNKIET